MHELKDENGNVISHGHAHTHDHDHGDGHTHTHEHSHEHGHEHEHTHSHEHTHEHSHGESDSEDATKETKALMTYMVDHNKHHAEELVEMEAKLRELGKVEVADMIEKGVAKFHEGNEFLSEALNLLKK